MDCFCTSPAQGYDQICNPGTWLWLAIKPTALWCVGWHSNRWAIPDNWLFHNYAIPGSKNNGGAEKNYYYAYCNEYLGHEMTRMCALSTWLLIFLFPVPRHPWRSLILFPYRSDRISASNDWGVPWPCCFTLPHTHSEPTLPPIWGDRQRVWIFCCYFQELEKQGVSPSDYQHPSPPILFNREKCFILQPSKYATNLRSNNIIYRKNHQKSVFLLKVFQRINIIACLKIYFPLNDFKEISNYG